MSFYKNNRNYVLVNNTQANVFAVEQGPRKGGVLSPALFTVVIDDMIKTKYRVKKLYIGYRKLQRVEKQGQGRK